MYDGDFSELMEEVSVIEKSYSNKNEWLEIFKTIPKPKGILAISAHWYTKGTRITTVKEPKMVYDMSGFPKELYEINYDAITDELLIKRVEAVLRRSTKSNSEELLQFEDLNLNLNTVQKYVINATTHLTKYIEDRDWN